MNILQTIVEEVGRRIVRGELAAGGPPIVEKDIVAEFGASRNVVREAVKTLAGKNLLRSERRNGMLIQAPEKWNLLDPQVLSWMLSEELTQDALLTALSELRMILEPEIAALAAERATPEQALRILACYDGMKRHAKDPVLAVEHDIFFHEAVLSASGNPLLQSLSESFSLLLRENFRLSVQVDDAFIRNLEDHYSIAEAIRDGDVERARRASLTLLRKNQEDIRKMSSIGGSCAS